jgi:hypothetical protein
MVGFTTDKEDQHSSLKILPEVQQDLLGKQDLQEELDKLDQQKEQEKQGLQDQFDLYHGQVFHILITLSNNIYIIRGKETFTLTKTLPNTDNKDKLFVTVFVFAPTYNPIRLAKAKEQILLPQE